MRRFVPLSLLAVLATSIPAHAASFLFATDPFAGSDALITPGRQVVGGEPSIAFDPAVDEFVFDQNVFGLYGVAPTLTFAGDFIANVPTSGPNVIVLFDLDNDGNPATPFNAGTAANLIAARLTTPTPGFFIYFNQGLDLPRLVFSTDLNDNTSDLKILARFTNLTGAVGQAALDDFTAQNFSQVPEPSSLLLLSSGAYWVLRRRRKGTDLE